MKEVFEDVFLILNFIDIMDFEFVGYELKEFKYILEEVCIYDVSYLVFIFVIFCLVNKEIGEIKI